MTNTQNHDESPGWEWESFAIACFVVIALSTLVGLIALPKKEGENLSLSFWALTIPFTISFSVVGCWLLDPREGCPLEDKKPNSATGNSEARREARADDPQVHTHAILDTSFDEKLAIVTKDVAEIAQRVGALDMALVKRVRPLQTKATTVREKEQQARYALIARLSDLGTETSPIDALQGAIQICSDARLWEHPARAATVHIDTQRLYSEGKIWPTIETIISFGVLTLIMIHQMRQMKISKRLSVPFVAAPGANILASITTAVRLCPSAVARVTHLSNAGNLRVRTVVLQF